MRLDLSKMKLDYTFLFGEKISAKSPVVWETRYQKHLNEDTPALNEEQQLEVLDIMNQAKYNLRLLVLGSVWILLIGLFMFLPIFETISHVATGIKVLFLVLMAMVFGFNVIQFREGPHDLLLTLMPGLLTLTFIYMIVWL